MTVVKICGICNLGDAQKSVELGAGYLGFIFAESERQISPAEARDICRKLRGSANFVGVFRNQDPRFINDIADSLRLDFVQLHGSESAEFCRTINIPVIKAVELRADAAVPDLSAYAVHAFLFDRSKENAADSNWLSEIVEKHGAELQSLQPFFIAGGLNAGNFAEALRLNPYGLDLASGVEASAGVKDHEKLELFFKAVQGAKLC